MYVNSTSTQHRRKWNKWASDQIILKWNIECKGGVPSSAGDIQKHLRYHLEWAQWGTSLTKIP